jgi:hypothetical protein
MLPFPHIAFPDLPVYVLTVRPVRRVQVPVIDICVGVAIFLPVLT